jgi:hypothetical protein
VERNGTARSEICGGVKKFAERTDDADEALDIKTSDILCFDV